MDNIDLIKENDRLKSDIRFFKDHIEDLKTDISSAKKFVSWIHETADKGLKLHEYRDALTAIKEYSGKALIEERDLKND